MELFCFVLVVGLQCVTLLNVLLVQRMIKNHDENTCREADGSRRMERRY